MQMRTFSSIDLWKSVPRVRRSRLLKVRPSNFLMECAKTLNAKGFSPWRGGSRTGPGRPLRRCFQRLNSLVKTQLPQGLKPSQKKEGFTAALKALRHLKTLALAPETTAPLRLSKIPTLAAKDAARMGHPKISCSLCWAAGPWARDTTLAGDTLEGEGDAAADGARGLDEIDGLAILAEDGNIALRQQVAHVDDRLHAAAEAGNRLAEENVEERIALSGRSVEHVDRSDGRTVDPSVRSNPTCVGTWHGSAQLGRESMPTLRDHPRLSVLQRHVGSR